MVIGGFLEAELDPRAEKKEPFGIYLFHVLLKASQAPQWGERVSNPPPWLVFGMSLGTEALPVLLFLQCISSTGPWTL